MPALRYGHSASASLPPRRTPTLVKSATLVLAAVAARAASAMQSTAQLTRPRGLELTLVLLGRSWAALTVLPLPTRTSAAVAASSAAPAAASPPDGGAEFGLLVRREFLQRLLDVAVHRPAAVILHQFIIILRASWGRWCRWCCPRAFATRLCRHCCCCRCCRRRC